MTIFASFDKNGLPLGFFDMGAHDYNLPEGAIEISFDQRQEFLDNLGVRRWDGEKVVEYTPPSLPPYIPDNISRRQFYQQLAVQEVITKQEALAAISNGEIPRAVASVIDKIEDEDEKFNAQMLLIGAQTFERLHPLSDTVKQIAGWTDEQRDQFWLDASKI